MPDDFMSENSDSSSSTSTVKLAPASPLRPMDPKTAIIPEDILAHIFLILCRDASNIQECVTSDHAGQLSRHIWDWICVIEVCRYWRTVATEAATLWSYLYRRVLRSSKQTERFLLMSKDSDLTVEYNDLFSSFDCLKTALNEMRRIRRLRIEFYLYIDVERNEELSKLLKRPAPRAETISLNATDYLKMPCFLLPLALPGSVRSVEFSGIDLSSNICRLSGLTNLSLQYCKSLSLSELITVLEASPSVSSLSIVFCDINDSSISESVYLPYLLHVSLKFKNFSDLYALVHNLEVPNLLGRIISCGEKLTDTDVARLSVLSNLLKRERDLHWSSISISSRRQYDKLCIRMTTHSEEESTETKSGETALSFPFVPICLNAGFQHLVDIFGSHLSSVEKLTVDDLLDTLTVDSWRTAFHASICARVVQAGIENVGDRGMNCLKALGLSFPFNTEGEVQTPCPVLEHIMVKRSGQEESDLRHFLSALEEVLMMRSVYGSAVRKLSLYSYSPITDDGKSQELSRWVDELEWTFRPLPVY